MNLLITTLLLKVQSGWFATLFQSIRANMTNIASTSAQVATELACIFIIINLVKLARTIMSDNQMGGMGGIDVAEIIRPIVFLMIIQSFSSILGGFDTTVQTVTDNLLDSSKNVTYDYAAGLSDIGNDSTKNTGNIFDFFKNLNPVDYLEKKFLELIGFDDNQIARILDPSNSVLTLLVEAGVGFLAWIEKWIMRVMMQMYLGLLAVTGPIVFAFSILDGWKDAWKTWLGTYIEVCFWGFAIEIIVLIGNVAHAAIAVEFAKNSPGAYDLVGQFKTMFNSFGASWIHVAISICVFKALKQVPSLVHMALGLGSGSGTDGAGGTTTAMASSAARAAKTAVGI